MVWTARRAKHRGTYQEPYGASPAGSEPSAAPSATDPVAPGPVASGSYPSSADPAGARSEEGPVLASPRDCSAVRCGSRARRSRGGEVVPPIRIGAMATLVILLGAWAALVAFIGPSFDYQATTASSWRWTTTNWLLHLVPGAVAVVGGLLILALWPGTSAAMRLLYRLVTLAVVAAGAWLVIGPAVWPVIESSSAYGPSGSAWTSFLHEVGANLGPGLLIVFLGGMLLEAAAAKVATTRVGGPSPLGPLGHRPATGGNDWRSSSRGVAPKAAIPLTSSPVRPYRYWS